MAKRPKNRMSIEARAKQFAPFCALRGLSEALAQKEKTAVRKIELSEDAAEALDRKMHTLSCGQITTVIYFHNDEYLKISGMVAKIDDTSRILQIVNTKIPFHDIFDIIVPDCPP